MGGAEEICGFSKFGDICAVAVTLPSTVVVFRSIVSQGTVHRLPAGEDITLIPAVSIRLIELLGELLHIVLVKVTGGLVRLLDRSAFCGGTAETRLTTVCSCKLLLFSAGQSRVRIRPVVSVDVMSRGRRILPIPHPFIAVADGQTEDIGSGQAPLSAPGGSHPVGRRYPDVDKAHFLRRLSGEGPGGRVEYEPVRKTGAIRYRCGILQRISLIDVDEAVGRHLPGERLVEAKILIGQRFHHYRRVVGPAHGKLQRGIGSGDAV